MNNSSKTFATNPSHNEGHVVRKSPVVPKRLEGDANRLTLRNKLTIGGVMGAVVLAGMGVHSLESHGAKALDKAVAKTNLDNRSNVMKGFDAMAQQNITVKHGEGVDAEILAVDAQVPQDSQMFHDLEDYVRAQGLAANNELQTGQSLHVPIIK